VSATQVRNIARGAQWNVAPEIEWPLKNCWLGVSVEDQAAADARIPHLLQTPAALRFVSVEPMLGPVKIPDKALCPCSYCVGGKPHPYCAGQPRIDWVICGGETGPSARPMHPAWARDLRDQCIAAGVPFFFKQWGDWAPCGPVEDSADFFGSRVVQSNSGGWSSVSHYLQTGRFADMGDDVIMERAGKARAGHLLDGREWRQFPHINHENTPIPEKRI
jgi:hypothetical protein